MIIGCRCLRRGFWWELSGGFETVLFLQGLVMDAGEERWRLG